MNVFYMVRPGTTTQFNSVMNQKIILIGGSWFAYAIECRSVYRFRFHPLDRLSHIGFRAILII